METHASFCSSSVFVCARRTCSIPHVSTLCNRSVLSYFILAYPFIRKPKQCILLMVFQQLFLSSSLCSKNCLIATMIGMHVVLDS